jgi:hypothetical protein
VEQSPPVAAELVDEDEEMDTGFLDQEPLADEGMKCEWDDGIAVDDTPPDVLTKTPAVRSEIMTDKITGRSVRRMIVDPDALPDVRERFLALLILFATIIFTPLFLCFTLNYVFAGTQL